MAINRRMRDILRPKSLRDLLSRSGGTSANAGPSSNESTPHTPKAGGSSIVGLHSGSSVVLVINFANPDLEITVLGTQGTIEAIEEQAKIYHKTLSSCIRFKWALFRKGGLENLINKLKEYNNSLIAITQFASGGMITLNSG